MTEMHDYYTRQLRLIEEFRSQLFAMEDKAESVKESYRKQLRYAKDCGFMGDYVENLGGDKFEEFSGYIKNLIDTLISSNEKLNKHEESITNLLNGGGGE